MPKNTDTQVLGLLALILSLVPAGFRIFGAGDSRFLFTHLISEYTGFNQALSAIVLVMLMVGWFALGIFLFGIGTLEARRHRRE